MALSKILPASQDQFAGARNLIINGAMQVAQRGTSASVSNNSNENYQTLDRWYFTYGNNAGGTVTVSQDSTVPSGEGFANSYKVDVTSADTSLAADDNILIGQTIESQNIANSGWNYTSSNSFVTASFYARSSVDTTLCLVARSYDAGYYYVKEFSLTANTWKRVTCSIPGNSNLVFDDNTGQGLGIWIILASGTSYNDSSDGAWNASFKVATSNQSNFLASPGNILHLTGVQLEVGEATPFEHRSFGDELAKCQRYFELLGHAVSSGGDGYSFMSVSLNGNAANQWLDVGFKVEKRAAPSSIDSFNSYTVPSPTATGIGVNGFTLYKGSQMIFIKSGGSNGDAVASVSAEL